MKTIEVGTFEAKNKLSRLVEKAAKGQRILITRRGHGVAMLCAPDAVGDRAAYTPEDILVRLRELRRSAKSSPESIKSLIEEGRR